jgi:ribonuclease HI
MINNKKEISCFTDGSSSYRIGNVVNHFGGIGVYFPEQKYIKESFSQAFNNSKVTNQRMELIAAIECIKKCVKIVGDGVNITLYSDSMYTIKIATEWAYLWKNDGWMRRVGKRKMEISNLDLVKELFELVDKYAVKFIHVRSHQREPTDKESVSWYMWNGNNKADKLAGDAMNSFKKEGHANK